jgi:hypothetical protein
MEVGGLVKNFLTVRSALEKITSKGILLGYIRNGFQEFDCESIYEPKLGKLENKLTSTLNVLGSYRYFTQGEILLGKNGKKVLLKMKNLTSKKEPPIDEKIEDCSEIDLENLLKYCVPAPYGDLDSESTVINQEVRNCLELSAESFSLEEENGQDPLLEVKQMISQELAHGNEISLVPHRLNIYKKGGHFQEHVDTPRDSANMIGTLIICLPIEYVGGQLNIREPAYMNVSRGKNINLESIKFVHEFDPIRNKSARIEKKYLSWVAIYGDCVHSVYQVQRGNRVTLTFDIHRTDKYLSTLVEKHDPDIVGVSEIELSKIYQPPVIKLFSDSYTLEQIALRENRSSDDDDDEMKGKDNPNPHFADIPAILSDLDFPAIGIILCHRYTQPALEQFQLKGADRNLVETLLQNEICKSGKYSLTLIPIVTKLCEIQSYDDSSSFEVTQFIYSMRSDDLDFLSRRRIKDPSIPFKQINIDESIRELKKNYDYRSEFLRSSNEKSIGLGIPFYRFSQNHGDLLKKDIQQYIEHTGNESQPYELRAFYFGAAVVLEKSEIKNSKE